MTSSMYSLLIFRPQKSLGTTPTGLWRIPMMSCEDEKMLNISTKGQKTAEEPVEKSAEKQPAEEPAKKEPTKKKPAGEGAGDKG